MNEFFHTWQDAVQHQASPGWQRSREQLYRDYIAPSLGSLKLQSISPPLISKVLNSMEKAGKSEQTRLHAFNLLRKVFGDAIELFQVVTFNPVLKKLKPKVPRKEAPHLDIEQAKCLLDHVVDKSFGVAIWCQLYLGLRIARLPIVIFTEEPISHRWRKSSGFCLRRCPRCPRKQCTKMGGQKKLSTNRPRKGSKWHRPRKRIVLSNCNTKVFENVRV